MSALIAETMVYDSMVLTMRSKINCVIANKRYNTETSLLLAYSEYGNFGDYLYVNPIGEYFLIAHSPGSERIEIISRIKAITLYHGFNFRNVKFSQAFPK